MAKSSGWWRRLQEAVAVRGNQILRVGSNRDVKRLRRAQTVVLDAHGGTVIPGLNDGHVQLMEGALALDELDLSPATTLDDLETEIRHYAEDDPLRPWVLARNGDVDLLSTSNIRARIILAAPCKIAGFRDQRGRQHRVGELEGTRRSRHQS